MEICYIIISCTYIYIYVSSDYLATGLLSGSSTSVNRLPPHVHMRRPHSGVIQLASSEHAAPHSVWDCMRYTS